jgi:hypothetical protein
VASTSTIVANYSMGVAWTQLTSNPGYHDTSKLAPSVEQFQRNKVYNTTKCHLVLAIPQRMSSNKGNRFLPLQQIEIAPLSRGRLPSLLILSNPIVPQTEQYARRTSTRSLRNPHMRYMRLIGNSNPRYQWEQYRKSPEELKKMQRPV